jgi:sulfite reductase beta subunit-like hemoprotein
VGVIKDGRKGFAVRIGGGLSSTPRISRDMGVFVPYEEALEVLRAIIDCWKENPRYRLSRVKARLKFMVDDYGAEEYRRMVEERLGRRLEDFQAPEPVGETDHLGVQPQSNRATFTSVSPFLSAGFRVTKC